MDEMTKEEGEDTIPAASSRTRQDDRHDTLRFDRKRSLFSFRDPDYYYQGPIVSSLFSSDHFRLFHFSFELDFTIDDPNEKNRGEREKEDVLGGKERGIDAQRTRIKREEQKKIQMMYCSR